MSAITTHILDAVLGRPAAGVAVLLERQGSAGWATAGKSVTDQDGRCRDLCPDCAAGTYRLRFAVGPYFAALGRASIYPEVAVAFVADGLNHYHIPLLLSENSYTTYRGS